MPIRGNAHVYCDFPGHSGSNELHLIRIEKGTKLYPDVKAGGNVGPRDDNQVFTLFISQTQLERMIRHPPEMRIEDANEVEDREKC